MYSQTGYRIITQRDCNPRSPLYSSTRTISEYNSSLCGLYSFGFVNASYSDGSEQNYRISFGGRNVSIKSIMGSPILVSDIDGMVNTIYDAPSNITYANFMSVATIGQYCFRGCSLLSSVIIPNAVSIETSAFDSCTALRTIDLPNVETISNYAFYGCTTLTSITLPKATMVESYAFYNCSALSAIDLPQAEDIRSSAFRHCTALTSISLPKAKRIYCNAFSDTALEALSLPKVTLLSDYALANMSKLKSVYLDIGEISYTTVFWDCSSLTDVTIENMSILKGGLLTNCKLLTNISLPSVTIVSANAFYNAKFSYVELPMASNIGTLAFYKCENLETISLPKAVVIASSAFSGCTNLKSIYVTSTRTTKYGDLNPEYESLYVIISK